MTSACQKMSLQTDRGIGNQCGRDISTEFEYNGNWMQHVSTMSPLCVQVETFAFLPMMI